MTDRLYAVPSLSEKLAYLIGGIGKDLIYWLITAYFMLFLSISGRCSTTFILTLFISGRIIDALNDPIMGLLADFTRTRCGKFKPWIAVGTLGSAVLTLALFYVPDLAHAQYHWYVGTVYILWTLFYTMMDIPYWSLIPGFGAAPRLREQMAAAARLGALIGGQLIIWAGSRMLQQAAADKTPPDFHTLALWAAGGFILAELILLFFVQDRSLAKRHPPLKLKKCLRLLYKNEELWVIITLTVLQQVAIGLFNTVLFTVIASAHGASQHIFTLIIITSGLAQAAGIIALPLLIKLTGRRLLFICSCLGMAGGYLLLCILHLGSGSFTPAMAAACALSSAGAACSCVMTTVMLADCVDYGEFKLGARAEGLLFSAQTMSAKLGLAAAYLISGLASAFTAYLPLPYKVVIVPQLSMRLSLLLAAVTALCLLVIYLKSYRLHGVFFKTMLNTLELLREPAAPPGRSERAAPSALPENLVLVRYALDQSCIIKLTAPQSFEQIIGELCRRVSMMRCLNDPQQLQQAVLQRHNEYSCAIAQGIVIAHARGDFVQRPVMALAVLPQPLPELTCPDGTQCDLIFLIACPDDSRSHLTLLGRLSLMLNVPGFADKLRQAGSRHEIYDRLLQCSLKIACSKN